MILEQDEYNRLVAAAYKKMRTNNELSTLLARPTRAKLRKACGHVYQERYDTRDQQILTDFFGPGKQGRNFLQVIQQFDPDRLRALDNYLKGETDKTDELKIELLAWLIDFNHRPYSPEKDFLLTGEEKDIIDSEEPVSLTVVKNAGSKEPDKAEDSGIDETKEPDHITVDPNSSRVDSEPGNSQQSTGQQDEIEGTGPLVQPPKPAKELRTKTNNKSKGKIAIIAATLLASCVALYFWTTAVPKDGCVQWAADHYESIECGDQSGSQVIQMSEEERKSFRKIMQVDTISDRSIGKIYFIQTNKQLEFFTGPGLYPEDPTRYLRKLTRNMYNKHLADSTRFAAANQ